MWKVFFNNSFYLFESCAILCYSNNYIFLMITFITVTPSTILVDITIKLFLIFIHLSQHCKLITYHYFN